MRTNIILLCSVILFITCEPEINDRNIEKEISDHLHTATDQLGKERDKQAAILIINQLHKQLKPIEQRMAEFRKKHGYKGDAILKHMQGRLQSKCGILKLAMVNLYVAYHKDISFVEPLNKYKASLRKITRYAFD